MQIDISIQHHSIVLGKGSTNLADIMKKTSTKIMFPDATDVNIKPLKRSQVTITGSIDNVYLARQQLIGSLPVALIFDYPESTIDGDTVNNLMYTYNVFVAVRQKSRQSTLCVVIKGIEKYITNIYQARHELLNLNHPHVVAEIPNTYFFPNEDRQPPKNNTIVAMLQNESSPPFVPYNLPSSMTASSSSTKDYAPPCAPSAAHSMFPMNLDFTSRFQHLNANNSSNSMPDISDTKRFFNNSTNSHNSGINHHHHNSNLFASNFDNSSGYQSGNYSFSSSSFEQQSSTFNNNNNSEMLDENGNYKMHQHHHHPHHQHPRKLSIDENALMGASSRFFNVDARMIDGYNAMNSFMNGGGAGAGGNTHGDGASCSSENPRTPKMGWQGIGLSRTTPAPLADLSDLDKPMSAAKFNMSTQLVPDFTSNRQRERVSQYGDVASILISLGLEQHIGELLSFFSNSIKKP